MAKCQGDSDMHTRSHRSIGCCIDGWQSSKSRIDQISVVDDCPALRCWVLQSQASELNSAPILHIDSRLNATEIYGST